MEELDNLIEYLCEYIKRIAEEDSFTAYEKVAENVDALAKLVSARANMKI